MSPLSLSLSINLFLSINLLSLSLSISLLIFRKEENRSQYSTESYDYPPNIRESFSDLGRTIAEKAHLLSNAGSAAEAQAALTAPPSAKPQPKTFSHAMARAALASSSILRQQQHDRSTTGQHGIGGGGGIGEVEDPLATALEKYALASERVGEARLAQDKQIQTRYLAGWSTTLNTNLMFATRARKNVENSRLLLDAAKHRAKLRSAGGGGGIAHAGAGTGVADEQHQRVHEEARLDVEQAEDEFVGQTEEAVGVMKNVGHHHHHHHHRHHDSSADGVNGCQLITEWSD